MMGKIRIITWLIEKVLLDQLLVGRDPNEVFAKDAGLTTGKKALSERINANSTSTWMVSGLKAAPIAATAIRRSQFGLGTSKILLTSLGGCGRRSRWVPNNRICASS